MNESELKELLSKILTDRRIFKLSDIDMMPALMPVVIFLMMCSFAKFICRLCRLEEKLDIFEYVIFVKNGYFTIRRHVTNSLTDKCVKIKCGGIH